VDFSVGQAAIRGLRVTSEMIQAYLQMPGDYNPLHFDEEFTAKPRFGRMMAQGG
jgi:acyl dehydratase